MNTCFFIGHHDAPRSIQDSLNAEVERLVKYHGVTEFIVGAYGNFDTMATIAVQKIKSKYPDLYAYRLLVYPPEHKRPILPALFDDLYYPLELFDIPKRFAISRANRLMIDQSAFLITYVHRDGGNAAGLLRHARARAKQGLLTIINIDF